jgi:hypothetical protein
VVGLLFGLVSMFYEDNLIDLDSGLDSSPGFLNGRIGLSVLDVLDINWI